MDSLGENHAIVGGSRAGPPSTSLLQAGGPDLRLGCLVNLDVALCLAAVGASLAVWWPILRADFVGDELASMVYLASEGPVAFILESYAGHLLHLRNTIFWLTYLVAGIDPLPYLATSLATHAVNVALLYAVARVWLRSRLVAFATAFFWGTAPILAGSLEWYAAYGHVLAGTLLLVCLLSLGRHVERGVCAGRRTVLGWLGLLLVGATCFGTGIAVCLVFPLAALLFVPGRLWGRGARLVLCLLPVVLVVMYETAPLVHRHFAKPRGFSFGASATLTGLTRHLLEQIVDLVSGFVATATSSLVLGWGASPVAAESPPWSTAVLIVVGGGLALALAIGGPLTRRRVAGLLLVSLAAYGSVALGRGSMMMARNWTVAQASAVSRYHYLPSISLALTLGVALSASGRPTASWRALLLLLVGVGLGSSVAGWRRAGFEPWNRQQMRAVVQRALESADRQIDALPPGSVVVLVNADPAPRTVRGILPFAHLPGAAGFLFAREGSDRVRGRIVRFVEGDSAKLAAVRALYSGAIRDMLIAPSDVGAVLRGGDARTLAVLDAPTAAPSPAVVP